MKGLPQRARIRASASYAVSPDGAPRAMGVDLPVKCPDNRAPRLGLTKGGVMSQRWHTRPVRSRVLIALVVGVLGCVIAVGAFAQSGGKLIGKLEGPEVVTDPAKAPKTLKEAPQ